MYTELGKRQEVYLKADFGGGGGFGTEERPQAMFAIANVRKEPRL